MAATLPAKNERPTVSELHGDHHFAQLASETWLGDSGATLVQHDFVKEKIWDVLSSEKFSHKSLLVLENLQLLEKLLWPSYSDHSSDFHVILIAIIANFKSSEGLFAWDTFASRATLFPSFFRRVLSSTVDPSLPLQLQSHLISFVTVAFQSLDNALIRKECAPLVSVAIWTNLHSEAGRERVLTRYPQWRKPWRAAMKRYEAADDEAKSRLRFERSWLFSLMIGFLKRLSDTDSSEGFVLYAEKLIDLVVNLESQLPTRRYVNVLLHDLNFLPCLRLSRTYSDEGNGLIRDLFSLLRHYMYFSLDEATGAQLSRTETYDRHCAILANLQRIALKHFKEKLTVLALSNYGAIDKRQELETHFRTLSDEELLLLAQLLHLRTIYPESSGIAPSRSMLLECICSLHEQQSSFQDSIQRLSILPTEASLFEPAVLRNETYDGSAPLAIPKLNLQYLTTGDFLWRSFILYRLESFFEIRKDVEDVIKRLQPRFSLQEQTVRFDGFSKMALQSTKPAILEVSPSLVGDCTPASVRAEIAVDRSRLTENIRHEWDTLKPGDVVFLLAIKAPMGSEGRANGSTASHVLKEAETLGLKALRAAEIVQILDDNSQSTRNDHSDMTNGDSHRPRLRRRRYILKLDASAYKSDMERVERGKQNVYDSINVLVRRKSRENNFKRILESIRSLASSDVLIPSWFQEVFLGYGDPTSANYTRLPNRLYKSNFRDTFTKWSHLVESFPGRVVEPSEEVDKSFPPPYVLEFSRSQDNQSSQPSRKRRRDQVEESKHQNRVDKISVSTYQALNNGPYPINVPKLNSVAFTPAQTEAIVSGTQPGLSVIIGPPGTGKTDVAVQIVNLLYHNFPEQRTLLVAHSNQALNQLFQKITKLDIDERHLLRLGHGEEELESDNDFSKYGRVESFLKNRAAYLAEVDRLAANFGVQGAHGSSCETADYFNSVYVRPAWNQFKQVLGSIDASPKELVEAFPFSYYFSNAPQPLFPEAATQDTVADIAEGCYRHINKIFAELEDIRPFELLRNQRDRSNYLLVKEARVIAMTTTHAAIRRQEIADLGFKYHNLVMEEAAQVTEIETFIPLVLQDPMGEELPLERVVLCGDHQQNSPIISNFAFRKFANLEQSMFLRFVRLGVPTINLDQQGRARPSIASLYSWRYDNLGNLPLVEHDQEFQTANAGLAFDYQFIDVADYKGAGEAEPTPHWIQNLGEAEYVVALYQYMRLLQYPAARITILTPYAGQRALIQDVLNHRCAKNPLFGLPKTVATVDRYQGEQNDYILLSLTRTSRVGYLRDIRRMTVALSRARLGLYIFGRRTVFEACLELREAFDRLLSRPDQLQLVTGEMFPTSRGVSDGVEHVQMEGIEHLGKYVYEMTTAKIEALKKGRESTQKQIEA